MLFADDVVLIEEMKAWVNAMLEIWREILGDLKGFRVSKLKAEYMMCKFSGRRHRDFGIIEYLGSLIQKDREINGDVIIEHKLVD